MITDIKKGNVDKDITIKKIINHEMEQNLEILLNMKDFGEDIVGRNNFQDGYKEGYAVGYIAGATMVATGLVGNVQMLIQAINTAFEEMLEKYATKKEGEPK